MDGIRILILDDEPIVCKRLKSFLEKRGYVVETFTKSLDALDMCRKKDFHVVITDLKMEGLDGMEFLTTIKKMNPKTEVIVITGFATMDTAKECFKKGVTEFLAKPFSLDDVEEAVKKAIKRLK